MCYIIIFNCIISDHMQLTAVWLCSPLSCYGLFSYLLRSYEDIDWDMKLPPKVLPPATTLERQADPVSHRFTDNKRYDPRAHYWQVSVCLHKYCLFFWHFIWEADSYMHPGEGFIQFLHAVYKTSLSMLLIKWELEASKHVVTHCRPCLTITAIRDDNNKSK